MAIGFTGPAVDDLGPVDGFAVGTGTGVKWVLQQRDDICDSGFVVQSNAVIVLPSDGRGKCTPSTLSTPDAPVGRCPVHGSAGKSRA